MKNIVILGSTGSIGINTINIVKNFPERFRVVGLAVNQDITALRKQIFELNPEVVAVASEAKAAELKESLGRKKLAIITGPNCLSEIASHPGADTVVNAVVGGIGLSPTYQALKLKKTVLLANKESLVAGGHLIMPLCKGKSRIIPIDSEHSAIFQCLQGQNRGEVDSLILTASGGPFYKLPRNKFSSITVEQALNHPRWKMGKKISIDSATMMNKGLEVIEGHWLFGMDYSMIKIVIHPQSIIHSLVQFRDGSILAQLGVTDMRLPISYALSYPERLPLESKLHLNLSELGSLDFSAPDMEKFPCLGLAYQAGKRGGSATAVLNSANEEAVALFLSGRIGFTMIPKLIEKALSRIDFVKNPSLDEIHEISRETREFVTAEIK
ncbi:MAG: 1-deoxy-D-xylulose-5-phosphate reductoisomerase [Candidatus Wallbacteria bacterium]|nr:1-deoxy-D-xylulose-5-phosphate reductoisomerase [Candidatus Wallbacteria bacterium]